MLPIPVPELVLEAARVVVAENRLASLAEAEHYLAQAEEWGAGMCCPEALVEYRMRRSAAEAEPAVARRTLLHDAALLFRETRRAIDAGLAADWRNETLGMFADEAHEVAAKLVALRVAALLLEFQADPLDGEMAEWSASGGWDQLNQYFEATQRLWAAALTPQPA